MKATEKHAVKEETEEIISKPFPGKVTQGQSMIDKFEYAKAMSASIKSSKKSK